MSLHRFFATGEVPLPAEEPVELPLSSDDRHHLVHVLRMRPDERIELAAPGGGVFEIELRDLGSDIVTGEVLRELPVATEYDVTLVQGLAKGSKLELVIEKATEVGVTAVWPVAFLRSVVHLDGERAHAKGERWRRVARAAAKQAGRARVPDVLDPQDSTGLVARLGEFDLVLVAWEESTSAAPGIGEALRAAGADADSKIAVVVGPEGGLTDQEVAALVGNGAVAITLGENVLRTETAGILSVALCVYEIGGLGGRSRG